MPLNPKLAYRIRLMAICAFGVQLGACAEGKDSTPTAASTALLGSWSCSMIKIDDGMATQLDSDTTYLADNTWETNALGSAELTTQGDIVRWKVVASGIYSLDGMMLSETPTLIEARSLPSEKSGNIPKDVLDEIVRDLVNGINENARDTSQSDVLMLTSQTLKTRTVKDGAIFDCARRS